MDTAKAVPSPVQSAPLDPPDTQSTPKMGSLIQVDPANVDAGQIPPNPLQTGGGVTPGQSGSHAPTPGGAVAVNLDNIDAAKAAPNPVQSGGGVDAGTGNIKVKINDSNLISDPGNAAID